METQSRLRFADVFVPIDDPRQASKVEHDLVELLVVAVNAVRVGAELGEVQAPTPPAIRRWSMPTLPRPSRLVQISTAYGQQKEGSATLP